MFNKKRIENLEYENIILKERIRKIELKLSEQNFFNEINEINKKYNINLKIEKLIYIVGKNTIFGSAIFEYCIYIKLNNKKIYNYYFRDDSQKNYDNFNFEELEEKIKVFLYDNRLYNKSRKQ